MNHYASLKDYCEAINIPPPQWEDFDVRSFEENMKTVHKKMPPFKHEFYAIALKLDGSGYAKTGNYSTENLKATLFFNSPYQILQWDIAPDWDGFYIIFSEDFYRREQSNKQISADFPFLLVDNTVPLTIDNEETVTFVKTFEDMLMEHKKNDALSKTICHLNTQILLHKVGRLFDKKVPNSERSFDHRNQDLNLVSRFKALLETSFYPNQTFENGEPHKVQFYAEQLNIHPNHLNAIVKRITHSPASEHIQHHMLALAKSKLSNTSLSIKEIAFDLYYNYPNHFANFFKKQMACTPMEYRKRNT